jgi:antitoxin (DNA-binding transcriptional repressor) of toxin-antitoxin stability system
VKAVGIKQLKARLSEYLRLVKTGETIFVTERDEVVAEVRPARRRMRATDELEDLLDSLSEAGDITRAALPKRTWGWRSRGIGLPTGTAMRILDELRADRHER